MSAAAIISLELLDIRAGIDTLNMIKDFNVLSWLAFSGSRMDRRGIDIDRAASIAVMARDGMV